MLSNLTETQLILLGVGVLSLIIWGFQNLKGPIFDFFKSKKEDNKDNLVNDDIIERVVALYYTFSNSGNEEIASLLKEKVLPAALELKNEE